MIGEGDAISGTVVGLVVADLQAECLEQLAGEFVRHLAHVYVAGGKFVEQAWVRCLCCFCLDRLQPGMQLSSLALQLGSPLLDIGDEVPVGVDHLEVSHQAPHPGLDIGNLLAQRRKLLLPLSFSPKVCVDSPEQAPPIRAEDVLIEKDPAMVEKILLANEDRAAIRMSLGCVPRLRLACVIGRDTTGLAEHASVTVVAEQV
ncbi:hypothetical protein ACWIGW_24365 [Nocardia brasiliensis]